MSTDSGRGDESDIGYETGDENNILRREEIDIMDCTDSVIKIEVGIEPTTTFYVHRELLCKSSELLKRWKEEGQLEPDSVVRLPETTARAFRLYSSWLYNGRIHASVPKHSCAAVEEHFERFFWPLVEGYTLSEQLEDDIFGDAAISRLWLGIHDDIISQKIFLRIQSQVVDYAYNNTDANSPLRRLLIDFHARKDYKYFLEEKRGRLPYDFVFDVMLAYNNQRMLLKRKRLPTNPCDYHLHPIDIDDVTGEDCPRKKAKGISSPQSSNATIRT